MESIYAALLLHKASKKITAVAIGKILTAAGVEADKPQITKLVAGLKEADIDTILATATPIMAAPAAGGGAPAASGAKEEEEEEEVEEEPTGIGSLF